MRMQSNSAAKRLFFFAAVCLCTNPFTGLRADAEDIGHFGEKSKAKLAELNLAILKNPKSSATFVARGDFHAAADDQDRALLDYNRAITLDPHNGMAFLRRGMFEFDQSLFKQAAQDFLIAGKLFGPGGGLAMRNAGRAQIKIHEYPAAVDSLNKAAAIIGPKGIISVLRERARAYFELAEYKRCMADLDRVIATKTKADDESYALRAKIKMKLGDFHGAVKDLTAAISEADLRPTNADLFVFSNEKGKYYQLRAQCFKKLGQPTREQSDLKKAELLEKDRLDFAPFR